MATNASRSITAPSAAQRSTIETTPTGPAGPLASASALAPLLGIAGTAINPLSICGADVQVLKLTFPSFTAGSIQVQTATLPLPNLPTPFTPAPNDRLLMLTSASISVPGGQPVLPSSTSIVSQGFISGLTFNTGPKFQTGVKYAGWSAVITQSMYATSAVSGSTTVLVTLTAILLDTPG